MSATPAVSIITPVRNTLPYLGRWFGSLLGQSLDPALIEVIAVDDGSDDGSGEELERLAAAHPALLTVLRLPDRGGPARARNRALDRATGRYLYFVDSDDYLAAGALADITGFADAHGSDIVLGRMQGENGRSVASWIYAADRTDVAFPDRHLAESLNVTKLFRREFTERYRLRFREDLPVMSDQPYALEAYFRAGRTSVFAERTCYHLVRRADESNISYSSAPEDRLRATEASMAVVASFTVPGAGRDLVNRRHFGWDLAPLLGPPLLGLPEPARRRLLVGVGRLVERHYTDGIAEQLRPADRRAFQLLREGRGAELLDLLGYQAVHGSLPVPLRVTSVGWLPDPDPEGVPVLSVSAHGRGTVRALAAPTEAPQRGGTGAGPGGRADAGREADTGGLPRPRSAAGVVPAVPGAAALRATVPLGTLLPRQGSPAGCWAIRLESVHAGLSELLPVPAPVPALAAPPLWRRGLPYRAASAADPDGGLLLLVERISLPRALRQAATWRLRATLRHHRRKPPPP